MLIRDLIKQFGSPKNAVGAVSEIGLRIRKKISLCSMDEVEREIEISEKAGVKFVTRLDPDYPPVLAKMDGSPLVLAYKGNIHLLKNMCVGIVGSRNASLAGRQLTYQIAQDLVKEGVSVVSGLASGIDTEAHKGSLHKGTVGVIAGGIDNIYPKSNEGLYKEIETKGLILSERPYKSPPQGKFFPLRNRIIAGLCRGVLIVEAGERSGSLITARIAGEEGREVLAVPNFPLDPRAKGTNKLIKEGAALVENCQDVLFALRWNMPQAQEEVEVKESEVGAIAAPPVEVSKVCKEEIFHLIGKTPVTVDSIIAASDFLPQETQIAIIELTLEGKIERQAGQRVARVFQE